MSNKLKLIIASESFILMSLFIYYFSFKENMTDVKWVVLLTTCVSPLTHSVDEKNERKDLYITQINRWLLETTLPIFVVESSGYTFNEIKNDRLHVMTLNITDKLPSSSQYEAKSILYAIQQMQNFPEYVNCTHILKVSGRYFLQDVETKLGAIDKTYDLYLQKHKQPNWRNSEYFGIRKELMGPLMESVQNKLMENALSAYSNNKLYVEIGPFENNVKRGGNIIRELFSSITEGFSTNTSIIPKNIFQTWKTLDVPSKMNQTIQKLQTDNPEFAYYLYDDAMCSEFIKDNFDDSVMCAYNKLIPTAYKADLWRYCILYKMGGIYLDIKYGCVGDFKLTQLTNAEHFVKDIEMSGGGVYNGVIACKPKNAILYKAIYKIVDNVNSGYYGANALAPTGPLLLKIYFSQYEIDNFKLVLKVDKNNQFKIYQGDKLAMISYPEYRKEQQNPSPKEQLSSSIPYYGILWNQRKIYKKGGVC